MGHCILITARHNQIAREYFDILPGTKPNLASVATHVHIPELLNHVGHVLKRHTPREIEFQRNDGHHFLLRVSPYSDENPKNPGGVAMTIADITDKKVAENEHIREHVQEYVSEHLPGRKNKE